MNKSTALREFGFNFLGPICSEYIHHMEACISEHQPSNIVFLAREGYFFQRAIEQLIHDKLLQCDLPRSYLHVSRTFLFRITIANKDAWKWSLSHSFSGELKRLLIGRFGFTLRQVQQVFDEETLDNVWNLPEDINELSALFEQNLTALEALVSESKRVYLQYVASLGLASSVKPLFIDVGYSGTIQKLLSVLLEQDSVGAYFITTQQGEHDVAGKTVSMHPAFKDDVRMGDGYTMLDRSLLLESLLTAPNGQFVDIKKPAELATHPFDFYFGRNTYTQSHFHELEKVFEGAIESICHNFKHKIRFDNNEIEMLFEKYAYTRNLFPRASWPLFDVDDAISGHGNVNPLQLFRI